MHTKKHFDRGVGAWSLGSTALGVILVLAFLLPRTVLGAAPSTIAPALERNLSDPDRLILDSDGTLAVWVFFVERELTTTELKDALAKAEAELTEKAARRRSKMAAYSRRSVNIRDLPLDADHLASVSSTGAALRHESRWLGAASYDATPEQVRAVAALPCVRRVDVVDRIEQLPIETKESGTAPRLSKAGSEWALDYGASLPGLELINVPPLHEMGYTGAGVTIGWLDSGFRMSHEALDHIPVLAAHDFVGDDDVVDHEEGDYGIAHSHGTQVLSAAMSYAPGSLVGAAYDASAVLMRVETPEHEEPCESDWWVAGLEWAEAQGADLISSSVGTIMPYGLLNGEYGVLTIAADMAAARGLLVINAAGNEGLTDLHVIVSPADGDSVIAVGATNANGMHVSWSSYGPTVDGRIKPDVVAQGELVTTVDPLDDFGYTIAGGTSLSAPFVASVAALILERAPFLTPMQIREALRMTASRHDDPDFLYGWGVVDALAAVFYWGPDFAHENLLDTEDTVGPYVVTAEISDQFPLTEGSTLLTYRIDGGAWQDATMTPSGGDVFSAQIPGLPLGSTVEYYFSASDEQGLSARLPLTGADDAFSFAVQPDTTPPVVTHAPLLDHPLNSWPPLVLVEATDNLRMGGVSMTFAVDDGPVQGPIELVLNDEGIYERTFPIDASELSGGELITYTITAIDAEEIANVTTVGPYEFEAVAGAGRIMVLDADVGSGQAETVAGWLSDAGYTVISNRATATLPDDVAGMQAVVFLAGGNPDPFTTSAVRVTLKNWVADDRPLLIEGGENGFVAVAFYENIARDVLHVSDWLGDQAGSLYAASGQSEHPLLNQPLAITPPLRFDSPTDTDQEQARALVINALSLLLGTGDMVGIEEDPVQDPDTPPSPTRLVGVTPNPFNAHAEIRVEMSANGPAQLNIYDTRGRIVRRLFDGRFVLKAGTHDFAWDGRDDHGSDVSSGVYFVRFSVDDFVQQTKLALVR